MAVYFMIDRTLRGLSLRKYNQNRLLSREVMVCFKYVLIHALIKNFCGGVEIGMMTINKGRRSLTLATLGNKEKPVARTIFRV